METIKKVSVNGQVYDLGGSSENEENYVLPSGLRDVTSSTNRDDFINLFGGEESFNSFITLVQNGSKRFFILVGSALYPVRVQYANVVIYQQLYFSWLESGEQASSDAKKYNINAIIMSSSLSITRLLSNLAIDKEIRIDIYNLTEDSTDSDIKTALTSKWTPTVYQSDVVQYNLAGTVDVRSKAHLGVTYQEVDGNDTYTISCNLPGCFGKDKGGIIHIKMDASTGEYSVTKIDAF